MVQSCGLSFSGEKVLILGSGGASAAVYAALLALGSIPIIISRTGKNNYHNLEMHQDAFAIVNATPVGMYPNNMESLIQLDQFPKLAVVIDLIYNPNRTKLLMDAESLSIATVNGLGMLVAQAKESAEWFTGSEIPNSKIQSIQTELMKESRNIILIGMPGCGKSTIGKCLAYKMHREFVDLDDVIFKEQGVSPAEIIQNQGEEYFRCLETDVIKRYGQKSSLVISTGGGCVTRQENFSLLHQNGLIIWIQRDLNQLATQDRPLSIGTDLQQMYSLRKTLYAKFSDFVVENCGNIDQFHPTTSSITILDVSLRSSTSAKWKILNSNTSPTWISDGENGNATLPAEDFLPG
jgi:shikimate dehydrogenase